MKPASFSLLFLGGYLLLAPGAGAGTAPASHALDFWLGEWEVYDNTSRRLDGWNRIELLLQGAAVMEHWRDVDGSAGKSWFYFHRPENRWKQVWVTDAGGVKEKAQVADAPAGSVRFRGELPLADGRKLLDQTTLTPLPGGRVRQVIEQSLDGGRTWRTIYDADYLRQSPPPP